MRERGDDEVDTRRQLVISRMRIHKPSRPSLRHSVTPSLSIKNQWAAVILSDTHPTPRYTGAIFTGRSEICRAARSGFIICPRKQGGETMAAGVKSGISGAGSGRTPVPIALRRLRGGNAGKLGLSNAVTRR